MVNHEINTKIVEAEQLINEVRNKINDLMINNFKVIKEIYKIKHPGLCVISSNPQCKCFLCLVDNMIDELTSI